MDGYVTDKYTVDTVGEIYEVMLCLKKKDPVYWIRRTSTIVDENNIEHNLLENSYLTLEKRSDGKYLLTFGPDFPKSNRDTQIIVSAETEMSAFLDYVGTQANPKIPLQKHIAKQK